MAIRITIYGLYDPRDEYHVRYVGFAVNPELRWRRHVAEAKVKKKDSYKLRWMRKVLSEGVIPRWRQIAFATSVIDGARLEAILIDQHRAAGHRITNVAPGGNGILLTPEQFEQWMLKMRSPEYRAAASAALRGKPKSKEHAAKVGAAHKGRPKSAAQRAKISATKTGHSHVPVATRAQISAKLTGIRRSLETRARMRESQQRRFARDAEHGIKHGHPMSKESRDKISRAQTGLKHSQERRASNSAAHLGRPHPVSDAMKQKRAAALRTPETREKMRAAKRLFDENRWETMAYMMATA